MWQGEGYHSVGSGRNRVGRGGHLSGVRVFHVSSDGTGAEVRESQTQGRVQSPIWRGRIQSLRCVSMLRRDSIEHVLIHTHTHCEGGVEGIEGIGGQSRRKLVLL
jgi:hypothetical protein